jgi:hypothetical protein
MRKHFFHGYLFLGLVYLSSSCSAQAQEPQQHEGAADGGKIEQADPFGGGDPFAVIDSASPASTKAEDGSRQRSSHRPDAKSAVFFKEFRYAVNDESRINPDNRIENLDDNNGALETRMTLSDRFGGNQAVRWLFKGFASTSSQREEGGDLRSVARIDEVFTDWKDHGWFVSLGKRRINWGHAQGFNPVNVVAPPRDPLNPTYETEGRPMAWISRGGRVTTDLVVTRNYDKNWASDQNRWGLRWSMSGAESDYAIYYFDGAPYTDGRAYDRMLGASFSANVVPGMTFYMEAADFSRNYRNYYDASGTPARKDGSFYQAVAGSTIDLGGKSSLFVEYYRNGQGYTEDERISYLRTADVRLASGGDKAFTDDFIALSMNRSYMLVGYKKEYRENYIFNLSILAAQDRSMSTRIEGAYALSDYYEIRVSYLRNSGDRNSEFGNNLYTGLLEIGLNASF